MRLRVVVFGLLGSLTTLLAAAVLLAPAPLLSIGPVGAVVTAAESANVRQLLVLGSLLVGLYLTVAARSATRPLRDGDGGDAFDAATADPPEAVTAARQRRTAEALATRLDAAVAGDEAAGEAVRARLRETVTAAYARSTGCSTEVARRAVDRGEWTDDRTAAAVLAGEDGPTHSLWSRLRLWLDPESERRRRLTHAVRAAGDLAEGWE